MTTQSISSGKSVTNTNSVLDAMPLLKYENVHMVRNSNMPTDICGGGCLVAKLCLTFATPWPVAHQAPLFMGLSQQEHWSGLPFPSPGDSPEPGIELPSPAAPTPAGRFLTTKPPGKPP